MRWTARPPRTPVLLAAIALLVAATFVIALLAATEAHFVPQVADLYLTCQYAKGFAEGHPFRYHAGEPPSSGATSLLHVVVLAAAYALGARGEGLVAFAVLSGAALFVAAVLVAWRAGSRLGGPFGGALGGGLVALGGPVVWGFLYGADIALALFLGLLLFDRWTAAWEAAGGWGWAWVGGLLSLARPEGLLVGAVLAATWTASGPRDRRHPLAWIPVLAGLLVLAVQRAATGSWIASSVADKSLVANYGLAQAAAVTAEYLVDVARGLLLGFYPSQAPVGFARGWSSLMFPPLGLVLVGLAGVALAPPVRRAVWGWLLAVAVAFAGVAPNVFAGVHFNRYVLWAFPTLLVLVAVGAGRAAEAAGRAWEPLAAARARIALAAVLLGLGALSTVRFAVMYGEMAGLLYRREVAAARWIAGNVPPGTRIAGAATSVEFLSGHRNVNLHGVTSPAFFGNRTVEREMGVLESLARLPAAERPPLLLTSAATQAGSATLRAIADGEPLFRTLSLDDELELYRTRYDALDRAARPLRAEALAAIAGLQEGDRLNVGDARDEALHEYAFVSAIGGLPVAGSARVDADDDGAPVADGGRAILGHESFRIATRPGRDLVIVMRTAADVEARPARPFAAAQAVHFAELALAVAIDGRPAARAVHRPGPGWDEVVVRVPAGAIQGPRPAVTVSGRYASFRYWFFQ